MLDIIYTSYLGGVIKKFIVDHNINELDFVSSHGHTALHQPEKGITLQIGNHKSISGLINNTVVCDFRKQDVALGGQGAPLVPIGDKLLFSEYDACLNLGGFSNISYNKNNDRIAFDMCPVNIVLNHYCRTIDLDFDDEGKIARSGILNIELLNKLNKLEYYALSHPKSLGIEWVNSNIYPLITKSDLSLKDILRTCIEHMAFQISKEINSKQFRNVLVTGGGAYNAFLIERLKHLTTTQIHIPEKEIIDFKEALIFGFLGVLKIRNEVNCLASVTGSKHDHSSGVIYSY